MDLVPVDHDPFALEGTGWLGTPSLGPEFGNPLPGLQSTYQAGQNYRAGMNAAGDAVIDAAASAPLAVGRLVTGQGSAEDAGNAIMSLAPGIKGAALAAPILGIAAKTAEREAVPAAEAVANGIRAFHGSPQEAISVVSANPPTRQFDNATSQFGAFFAPNAVAAQKYAGQTGRIYSTNIALQKPYEMPWSEFAYFQAPNKGTEGQALPAEQWADRAEALKNEAVARRSELAQQGHDGIIVRRSDGTPLEIASFGDVPVNPTIRAYHGSPHDFDAFDLSKIGTGEGAQAYGHGLYFAQNEGTAQQYRRQLAGKGVDITGTVTNAFPDLNPSQNTLGRIYSRAINDSADPEKAARSIQYGVPELRDEGSLLGPLGPKAQKLVDVVNSLREQARGRMYEVNIAADPEHFLDWDEPLNAEHPVRVRLQALAQMGLDANDYGAARNMAKDAMMASQNPNLTGEGAYRKLVTAIDAARPALKAAGNPRALFGDPSAMAADDLKQLGIPGIKYLDQGSRAPKTVFDGGPVPQNNPAAALAAEKLGLHGTPDAAIASLQSDATQGHPFIRDTSEAAADLLRSGRVAKRAPQGTSNYVVFDDKLISILRKYGMAGLIAGGAAHFSLTPVDHDPFSASQ